MMRMSRCHRERGGGAPSLSSNIGKSISAQVSQSGLDNDAPFGDLHAYL